MEYISRHMEKRILELNKSYTAILLPGLRAYYQIQEGRYSLSYDIRDMMTE